MDHNPLLLCQAGRDDATTRESRAIKRDFRELWLLVDRVGVYVVFSSIPSVAGRDSERTGKNPSPVVKAGAIAGFWQF